MEIRFLVISSWSFLSNHSGGRGEANWQKEIGFSSVLILIELLYMLMIDLSSMSTEKW